MASDVGINARNDTLSPCFFVSCCAINLPRKEKILDEFGLQRMMQLGRHKEVIFDGIARAVDVNIPKCRNFSECT